MMFFILYNPFNNISATASWYTRDDGKLNYELLIHEKKFWLYASVIQMHPTHTYTQTINQPNNQVFQK